MSDFKERGLRFDGLRDWFLSDEVSYGFDGLLPTWSGPGPGLGPGSGPGSETSEGKDRNNSNCSCPSTASPTSSSSSSNSVLNSFRYRPIQLQDREIIQLLHEEWFPVTYQNEFYDDLVRNGQSYWNREGQLQQRPQSPVPDATNTTTTTTNTASSTTRNAPRHRVRTRSLSSSSSSYTRNSNNRTFSVSTTASASSCSNASSSSTSSSSDKSNSAATPSRALYTCLAVRGGGGGARGLLSSLEDGIDSHHDACQHYYVDEEDPFGGGSYTAVPSCSAQQEEICACVVGCFLQASQLQARLRNLLLPSSYSTATSTTTSSTSASFSTPRFEKAFYIMTLGVVPLYRKEGLGSILVQKCQSLVEQDPQCGVLYLHVITFNRAAIRLYEKLGFHRVEEIENYYSIQGKYYNCYLYAKYFHGNRGHFRDLYHFVKETATVLWNQLWTALFPRVLMQYLPPTLRSSSHDNETTTTTTTTTSSSLDQHQ